MGMRKELYATHRCMNIKYTNYYLILLTENTATEFNTIMNVQREG